MSTKRWPRRPWNKAKAFCDWHPPGCRVFLRAGTAHQAASGRLLCAGRGSRRHRRALVLVDHAGRQRPEDVAQRRAELHRLRGRRKGRAVLLRDAIDELKGAAHRRAHLEHVRAWPMYSKFFDNKGALPFHIHHRDEHAQPVGPAGQAGSLLLPGPVEQLRCRLSVYLLRPRRRARRRRRCDSAWRISTRATTGSPTFGRLPARAGHGMGCARRHVARAGQPVHVRAAEGVRRFLDVPVPDRRRDRDRGFAVEGCPSGQDWRPGLPGRTGGLGRNARSGVRQNTALWSPSRSSPRRRWLPRVTARTGSAIAPRNFSAKELTVLPGKTVTIRDGGAYGLIMLQGHGTMGPWDIEAPAMIRYGQLTPTSFS